MNKRTTTTKPEVRLMSVIEGATYTGVGFTFFKTWAKEIGATVNFGRRVLYDKHVIDAAIDKLIAKNTLKEVNE